MFWMVFEGVRRIVVFCLGVIIFIDGVVDPEHSVPELVIGMVMVGILPVENVIGAWKPHKLLRRDRDVDDRQ